KVIRSLQPEAAITGPCGGFHEKWLEDFLLWARDNNCLPDVITWHQFGHAGEDSAIVTQNMAKLKKWMGENNIKIDRFSINEYIGNDVETNPGVAAWMMDDLERAKVESAAHACWQDADGSVEFHNCSLDGLLTNDQKPRSTWWTYKYYGDISGNLVKVSFGAGSVRGVAGYDKSKNEFRMIFGRGLGTGPADISADIPITIEHMTAPGFFSEGESVKVQARRVADSKWSGVPEEPPLTVDTKVAIHNGQITVILPKFGPSDSYAVAITKVSATANARVSPPTTKPGAARFVGAPLSHLRLNGIISSVILAQASATANAAAAPAALPIPSEKADVYSEWPFNATEAVRRQKETAAKLGLPVETQITLAGGHVTPFILIPAGAFVMGSPEQELLRNGSEIQHPVRITKPFYMGKYIFTQGEWKALMPDNPSLFKSQADSDKRPVEHVPFTTAKDHRGVEELLAKLQEVTPTGWKVRLPTEAEWEYACRAGTDTAFFCGDTITEAQANYDGTAAKEGGVETSKILQTTAVGNYPPNAWGLYDMAGNTLEWCQDWYDGNFYKSALAEDPCNTTPAAFRV
ncbi:MAG TPA: SUMF1/EgtB/PvdO family nonheme iron enzyme, partial [Candidatus Methylacidiphilales bacterium]